MVGTRNRLEWPVVSSDFWRDMHTISGNGTSTTRRAWTPAGLVVEHKDSFVLRLAIPGVDIESVEVDLDGHDLTVSGERVAPDSGEDTRVLVAELPWGRFHRSFRLGSEVDRESIGAVYRNGLLEITVPKAQEARPRRIPVSSEA